MREAGGVQATRTPDIAAPAADVLEAGTAFYGSAEVCVLGMLDVSMFLV